MYKCLARRWPGLLCTIAMAGCTTFTSGTHVTQESISRLRVGTTTFAEVFRTLGSPTGKKVTSDRTVYSYVYEQQAQDAVSAIPIVNIFVLNATVLHTELALEFDRNGILAKCTFTESNSRIEGAPVTALAGKMPSQTVTSETRECGLDPARVATRTPEEAKSAPIPRLPHSDDMKD